MQSLLVLVVSRDLLNTNGVGARQSFWVQCEWKCLFNTVSHTGRIWCEHRRGPVPLVMLQNQFPDQTSRT